MATGSPPMITAPLVTGPEHAAIGGRQHIALLLLLDRDGALRLKCCDLTAENIDAGLQLIELLLRRDTLADQRHAAGKFRLRIGQLRFQRLQLRIIGRKLEVDLVVTDDGDLLPGLDHIAFRDGKLGDHAADAGAGRNGVLRLDLTVNGLPLGHVGRLQGKRTGECRMGHSQQERGRQCLVHRINPSERAAGLDAETLENHRRRAEAGEGGLQEVQADEDSEPEEIRETKTVSRTERRVMMPAKANTARSSFMAKTPV